MVKGNTNNAANTENAMDTIKRHIPADLQSNYKIQRYVKCALCSSHVAPNAASNEKFYGGKIITVCSTCKGGR
tara:strand:+ start:539 stop:757 length:219 start_codon:yes stop_codon:yes gene_type:complete